MAVAVLHTALLILALILGPSLLPASAATAPQAEYQIGDQVREDIATPTQLLVFDPDETAARREKEAQKVPLVYRRDPIPQLAALLTLREDFTAMRESFLDRIETNYQRRTLGPKALESNRYQRLLTNFQNRHKNFPLTPDLAAAWAQGQPDTTFLAAWTNLLLSAATQPIRPDPVPDEFKKSGARPRILEPGATVPSEPSDLDALLTAATSVHRTNILSRYKARQAFQQSLGETNRTLARHLARFLESNLILDESLSRQWRSVRVEPIYAADPYPPGALLAARGDHVTPKILRAIHELNNRLNQELYQDTINRRESDARLTREFVQLQSMSTLEQLDALSRHTLILSAAAVLAVVAGLFALWKTAGARRQSRSASGALIPAGSRPQALQWTSVPCPTCQTPVSVPQETPEENGDEDTNAGWRLRALEAERRADTASAAVRSRLMPDLVRWAKTHLLRGLVTQRDELIENQSQAEREINDLANRLSQIHAPMEERLKAYENRITQLEEQLRLKGEENQALIQARLEAARRKLADELDGDARPRVHKEDDPR